jgi:uncharacterized RDD family membrane protein YckC
MTVGRLRGMELLLDTSLHAYDPAADSRLFEGIFQRRIIAFMIDVFIIAVPVGIVGLFGFLFCTLFLQMNFNLLWLLAPLSALWALIYYGATMGAATCARIGMQTTGIEVRTW